MKRNRLAAYAIGIAVAAAMTGCGGDDGDASGFADEPTEDIVAAAQKAMGDLESVHLAGEVTTEGNTITMDMSLSTTGDCEGELSIDGGALEVLQVGGTGWFKADDAFWEGQAADQADRIIAAAGDKWVVDSGTQFTSFCDLDGFLEEIVSSDDDEEYEKDGTEDVDGAEAVKITGGDSTAFIAADDPHYILKLAGSGDGEGEITFSEFDEDIEVEAPADDEVVSLDQLG